VVQVLVLAGNAFQPFPSDGLGVIQSMSGSHLQLGAKGQAARDSFAQQVCAWYKSPPELTLTPQPDSSEFDCWHASDRVMFVNRPVSAATRKDIIRNFQS